MSRIINKIKESLGWYSQPELLLTLVNNTVEPTILTDDPRLGKRARRLSDGFTGNIVEISRWSDGDEVWDIKRGPDSTMALSHNFEIVEQ